MNFYLGTAESNVLSSLFSQTSSKKSNGEKTSYGNVK